MRVRLTIIFATAVIAASAASPASAQDACKNALELTARANELYASVGQALLLDQCVGLRDRIAQFDAAADALKEIARVAKELCRPAPTPEFDEISRAASMKEALNILEECRRTGKGD